AARSDALQTRDPGFLPRRTGVPHLRCTAFALHRARDTRSRNMNIALWLHRAGLSHGGRPAVAAGSRVVLHYGELAARAARLAGALRQNLHVAPGDRVAIVARNCVEYLELLYGIWHAGAAAVPVNARLHAAEVAFILRQSGARVCFASPGLEADIASHAPVSLERLIALGGPHYPAPFASDPI